MAFLEQLENELDSFQKYAWSAGISRPDGEIKATVAQAFAKQLSDCQEVDVAKTRMFEDPIGAQAFWIYSEFAIDELKNGSISTSSSAPPQSVFVELLASTVFHYCRYLIQRYGDEFALIVE